MQSRRLARTFRSLDGGITLLLALAKSSIVETLQGIDGVLGSIMVCVYWLM